jgi:acetyltransferase-like isoleucine patch superfamily enzyme
VGEAHGLAPDWHPGTIPDNVVADPTAYVGTSYSFVRFRSQEPVGLRIGRAATLGDLTILDVGPRGRVAIGDYALVNGALILCDGEVTIGDYALIGWDVVLMDTYRVPFDAGLRRRALERVARERPRRLAADVPARPIRIDRNVWIGFEACVLPGVRIGEGAVVGARAVVTEDVPPGAVVAGNPARVVRSA